MCCLYLSHLSVLTCAEFDVELKTGKMILLGDTQERGLIEFWRENNTGIRRQIFNQIAVENPDFLIHLGDLVYSGISVHSWHRFFRDFSVVQDRNIALFPVLGNHEYFGHNAIALDKFFAHFPDLNKAQWYHIRYDSLSLILLNSNFDQLSNNEISDQNSWYEKILLQMDQDPAIKYVIVICHHPPFTNSTTVHDDEKVKQFFIPFFAASSKALVFFSGHAHSFEHFTIENKHFIVSGGGGAPRHTLSKIDRDSGISLVPSGQKINDKFHFCKLGMEPAGIRIEVKCYDENTADFYIGESFILDF